MKNVEKSAEWYWCLGDSSWFVGLDDWILLILLIHTDITGMFVFFLHLRKKPFKVFGTSFLLDSISSLLTKSIASLEFTLYEREGLTTVSQNFLSSDMSFSFNFARYFFFSSHRRETQKLLFLCYVLVYFGQKYFLQNCLWNAFLFIMKDSFILILCMYFLFLIAGVLSTISCITYFKGIVRAFPI